MTRRDRVIEHTQTKTFLRLESPMQITAPKVERPKILPGDIYEDVGIDERPSFCRHDSPSFASNSLRRTARCRCPSALAKFHRMGF